MPSQTIGTSSVAVVSASAGRRTITFSNISTSSQVIYLDNTEPSGMSVSSAGYPLAPGEKLSFIFEFDGPDMKLPWSAIADAPGAVLYVKELNDRFGSAGGAL